jgi:hypothetical protein
MEFKSFGTAVARQFATMSKSTLFVVDVESDLLWQTYLASFPEGTNPVYTTRTEHDCSCCRHFVKVVGGVVTIKNGRVSSVWDAVPSTVDAGYVAVAKAMAALVRSKPVKNLFLHVEKSVGTEKSRQLANGAVKTWDHFFVNLPTAAVEKGIKIGPRLSESKSGYDVFLRSLREIPVDSVDAVLELVAQNSLYRGTENKFVLEEFRKLHLAFDKAKDKELFVWEQLQGQAASVARVRNTAIGSLLVDVSEGKELDDAVASYESKVAPTNYKRPTAVVTKAMVKRAQETMAELGLTAALERRYATIEDITINNVLFADRGAKKEMNVFDEIAGDIPQGRKFDKVEEVGIDAFLSDILPKADGIEVLFENRHAANLVSLIAPVDPTAKHMFKWDNNFSWSYSGDVTDSIKEKVKRAGGRIEADLRCSLSWFNYDDLDLHVTEPNGNEIYYSRKISPTSGGQLDVDMNAGTGTTRSAVENIFWARKDRIQPGIHVLRVHNFCKRETKDEGFDAEIEFDGQLHSFSYDKAVRSQQYVTVAKFSYSKKDGFQILDSLPSKQSSKQVWGLPTQTFHRAKVVMLSPNHWDDKAVGNKHYFFMLQGAANEEKARGFYNEFLSADLNPHRKVLELVGAKMRTDESDRQLSGLGFSSTQRNSLVVRVVGKVTRTLKVMF